MGVSKTVILQHVTCVIGCRHTTLTHEPLRRSTQATVYVGKLRLVDDAHKQKLAELEAKIEAAKVPEERKRHGDDHYSQAHLAWRMVIELVVGLGIGFAIGWGLDSLFGTLPLFLVVFVLLGFAAGVRTMMRTANEIQADKLAAEAAEKNTDEREGL